MAVLLVIPARYASSRFPGKPLVPLKGATGISKSLIQRSYEAGCAVEGADRVVVATDDSRIADACQSFGAEVVDTPETCRNGTERCAAALDSLAADFDLVVNLQGDAPLTPPWFVEALIARMKGDSSGVDMATPILRCSGKMLASLKADRRAGRVGGTTAVCDADGRALYFSKEVIPHSVGEYRPDEPTPIFHHVGVYAYRPDALRAYAALGESPLERMEGLEQLRFLEHGRNIACVEVESRGRDFWEVNNPEDVERVELMLLKAGLA